MEPILSFSFLSENWTWAIGLALSMCGLTAFATLLNQERKDDVALWLMGAHGEAGWSASFVSLFDAVFGDHHLSLKCFLRSIVASLISVTVIWLLMGNAAALSIRITAEITFGSLLVIGLAINVVADYVSLLETRWLLGRMPRANIAQIIVLIFDFVVSAAIIWGAIFLYLRSPLHEGEVETFAEILGVFSVFSVFFYSTFLTSVWIWTYIVSTWVMRLAAQLHLTFWLDVEKKPIRVLFFLLSLCVGVVTFTGSVVLSVPFRAEPRGVIPIDHFLCTTFKGRVCVDVAKLTSVERLQIEFLTRACEGGITQECRDLAEEIWMSDPISAAELLQLACDSGDYGGCKVLATFYIAGLGVEINDQEAARLLTDACDGGELTSCLALGMFYFGGIGVERDLQEAQRLLKLGCIENQDQCQLAFTLLDLVSQLETGSEGLADNNPLGTVMFRQIFRDLLISRCNAGNTDACRLFGEPNILSVQ